MLMRATDFEQTPNFRPTLRIDVRPMLRRALAIGFVGAILSGAAILARQYPALGDRAVVDIFITMDCPDYAQRVQAYHTSLKLKFVTALKGLDVCARKS